MALIPGTRLGPYEIHNIIGAGGMGEVYRARDPKLNRDVAVKILPELFAADPDRLARFEREAHTLASLSHPNILPIHDFGVSGGTAYAVTALLEGQTLRERLDRGPLGVRRVVEYGIAMASGLAAAHDKGVVHRDLKPENVFLTSDGRVILLDFGLARVTGAEPAGSDVRTMLSTATTPGAVLGTAGYMSPEQARGDETDARTDLFSLGAVLYEMATGRRAFDGPTAIDTMNAILHAEPAWRPADECPPPLQRVIERALEKSPAARFQSASDLAFALQQVSPSSGPASSPVRERWRPGRLFVWATGAIAIAVGAAVLGRWSAGGGGAPPGLRFDRLTFRPGNVLNARFSPDGGTVVYGASWEGASPGLFTVRADGGESRSLDVANANVAAISANAELAIIRAPAHAPGARGTLARLPMNGGAPRDVLEDVFAADWDLRGEQLAVVRRAPNGFQRVEYPIGHVLYESSSIHSMRMSPGGGRVAFIAGGELFVMESAGGGIVLRRAWGASGQATSLAWAPSGDAIYIVAGPSDGESALRRVDLAGHERVIADAGGVNLLLHDVSKNGDILVERATSRRGILYRGRNDDRERDLSWLDGSQVRSLSDDGAWVLFGETLHGAGPRGDVYIRRTDGSLPVRLGDGRPLSLSRDGKWVLAITTQKPARLVLLPTGPGVPRTLDTAPYEPNGGTFLPSGTAVGFGAETAPGHLVFYKLDLGTGTLSPLTVAGSDEASAFVMDRGFAFGDAAAGAARLLPNGRIEIVTPEGARRLVPGPPLPPEDDLLDWPTDGFLYASTRDMLPVPVYRIDPRTGARTPWRPLMPADPAGVTEIQPIVIARDGRSYAYSYRRVTSSDLFVIRGVH